MLNISVWGEFIGLGCGEQGYLVMVLARTSFIELSVVFGSAFEAKIYSTAFGNLAVYWKSDWDIRVILWPYGSGC